MAKKFSEWDKWGIPDDWDEEADGFSLVALCIPNSRKWRAVFNGQISDLAYGRNWNKHTGTIVDVQLIARDIFESMSMACLEDVISVIQCICNQTTVLAEKSEDTGQEVEGVLSDGDVATGPGEQFPDQETYFAAKCSVANAIFDTLRGMILWLEDNDVDLLAGAFGGITSGLLVGLALAGPVGWAWALAGSVFVGMAGYLIRYAISFTDVKDALDDTQEACVLALYNATDSLVAENNFIAALEAGSPVITSIESAFVGLMLSSEVVNQLFDPRADVAGYVSPSPIDCGAAVIQIWDFDSDVESWTFRDDSTANASATGSYNAFEEALQADQVVVAGGPGRITQAVNVSPTVALVVTPGASVQWDYSAPSDSIVVFRILTAFYTDATSEDVSRGGHTSAGTLVLTLTQSKTIETIECLTGRSNGSSSTGWTFETLTFEVRVIGA